MKRISAIQFVLENTETITVDVKFVGSFFVQGLEEDVKKQGGKRCRSIQITLTKKADVQYPTKAYEGMSVFQRLLSFDDIVSITFLDYQQNTIDTIFAPWHPTESEENEYQITSMTDDGGLTIMVLG